MKIHEVVQCHTLVIGAGGAGVRAAIEASRFGDTVLLSKAVVGKGGCTPMAEGGYNAVLKDQDSYDLHFQDTLRSGAFLNDPFHVKTLVENAPLRLMELVERGAVFDADDSGVPNQRLAGGAAFPRGCYSGDRTGHEIMTTLVEWLATTPVKVYHETTVVDLLKSGDVVIGAMAVDGSGRIALFTSDATVLAMGGGSRVYEASTNPAGNTGDGYALGYNAGAELIDMEMVQFHPTGVVFPHDARGRLVTEATRGEGGRLYNSAGERFMARYDPEHMELASRDVVSRAMLTEITEGRGTPHGGVYLDVSHIDVRTIEERLPVTLEQFLLYGIDIRRQPIEVAPTAHHVMGGLRIGHGTCRTTVDRLFACGESEGGVQGANRLGGNALAETQVFGKIAGESAGRQDPVSLKIDGRQVDLRIKELEGFLSGAVRPSEVLKSLQKCMQKGAGIFRDARGLEDTLRKIDGLSRIGLCALSTDGLAECCSVRNACRTAMLVCTSGLLRNESRGAHTRRDITTAWDAENSPLGHTFISLFRKGIERRV